ncbi:MAG: cytochrome c peroxidase [Candidatus Binatota bacterium]|jgi:cytochrome c peroxidase|nr:cytochrome c peroxidase [Candidatus Binatota bacterium]
MHRRALFGLPTACAAAVVAIIVGSSALAAQDDKSEKEDKTPPQPPVYDPYPPDLLPSDLQSEIDRVNAEIDRIFQETRAQAQALPINSGTAMRQVQLLGKLELFDKNLSVNRNEACTFCHMPYTGFSGPISSLNATTVAYPGSVRFRFGKRKPQGYTYSPYYPALEFNETQQDFYGGNFWDLRATGVKLQNPDSEQAQGPPHDTQEMGMLDTACVVYRLSQSAYRSFFEMVWGTQAFDIKWPQDIEDTCSTPAGADVFGGDSTPVDLKKHDRGRANATYDQFALSITAYERAPDVSPFSSKFDASLAGTATLTADEQAGYDLFRGKGNCNSCHLDGRGTSLAAGQTDTSKAANLQPLFTDFTSSNLGLPKNPDNPFYFQTTPDGFGFTANPEGSGFTDLGVGLFLRGLSGSNPNADWAPLAPRFDGKMQVSTVRNVDMRPCPTFVKAYMHNGYLKSLKEVVHFYNTRDTLAQCTGASGEMEKVTCWPPPEVAANMDMTVGKLGLSDTEEDQIVAFLQTLTDGYPNPSTNYTDFDTFSGSCP